MDLAGCICIHVCIYVAAIIEEDVMGLRVGSVAGADDTGELDRKEGSRRMRLQYPCREFSKKLKSINLKRM